MRQSRIRGQARDLNSFFRYGEQDASGGPNLLAKKMLFAIGQGNSQSGNFLRSFIHLGFNQDESKRMVFDGLNDNIAVRQLAMNFRFAIPGGLANVFEPGSDGVLTWSDYADEARHQPAGLAAGSMPGWGKHLSQNLRKTFGSSEFWDLRASILTWWEPRRTAIFRCRPMCGAIIFQESRTVVAGREWTRLRRHRKRPRLVSFRRTPIRRQTRCEL